MHARESVLACIYLRFNPTPPFVMSHWTAGQQLKDGKYIIEKLLGSGGFGVTYRARDQSSGRLVAIKTLNASQQSERDFAAIQEKFVNEAMRLASCRHAHIVQVYPQLFQQDGLWCMVMEYIEGQDLWSYLKDRRILSEEEALRYIRQVGDALSYIHNLGFLHRDIKPPNIMLRRGSWLRDLLKGGKWKEADEETSKVMLKAVGRESEGWLDLDSINNFPCKDLRTIDQLWVKYSNGRFGFSVQKRIWESLGGNPDMDYGTWCKFGDCVGWRVKGDWRYYKDLTFTLKAPQGHLPGRELKGMSLFNLSMGLGWVVWGFFSRIKAFKV